MHETERSRYVYLEPLKNDNNTPYYLWFFLDESQVRVSIHKTCLVQFAQELIYEGVFGHNSSNYYPKELYIHC